jgi:hypothetical protein
MTLLRRIGPFLRLFYLWRILTETDAAIGNNWYGSALIYACEVGVIASPVGRPLAAETQGQIV